MNVKNKIANGIDRLFNCKTKKALNSCEFKAFVIPLGALFINLTT